MYLVDTNVLVHAVNQASLEHPSARDWLASALVGPQTVAFSWVALMGFIRVSTHPRVLTRPLTPTQATAIAQWWLDQPNATVVEPQAGYLVVVAELLQGAGAAGDLAVDAHLAALALQHDAEVITYDRDLGRFPGVRWRTPSSDEPGTAFSAVR
jgi:toxin-antitoxin system PIN domain toxin